MTIDEKQLRAIITGEKTEVSPPELAKELLAARVKIGELERQLATPIRLPFSSASPVCEIEAGYAAASAIAVRQFVKPVFLLRGMISGA